MATKTVTFRVQEKKVKALDSIAGQQQRNRSFILNEAVDNYLAMEAYNRSMIEEGLRQARAGTLVPHEEVVAKFERLFAQNQTRTKKRAS
jgi:predicted transcriptional regulator